MQQLQGENFCVVIDVRFWPFHDIARRVQGWRLAGLKQKSVAAIIPDL